MERSQANVTVLPGLLLTLIIICFLTEIRKKGNTTLIATRINT